MRRLLFITFASSKTRSGVTLFRSSCSYNPHQSPSARDSRRLLGYAPRIDRYGSSQSTTQPYTSHSDTTKNMTPQLRLTRDEDTLRRLLIDVAEYIQVEDGKSEPSQLRFTGGWVRDKLLKKDSHDIDVAINDTTGYEFALRLEAYLKILGNWEKYEDINATTTDVDKTRLLRGLHKIQANPDKSKHLETCTIRVFGLDIDLVNLRKEVYDDFSRTPQMAFADGPEEDAFRRDATINAMFYNLQTEAVEDLTGRGHDDMQSKIIRTPLKPYKTFEDDPLRILRLIRFSSRLGYSLDPEAKDAMRDSTIKDALRKKISRERVGVEFEKMMKGMSALGLAVTVLIPSVQLGFNADPEQGPHRTLPCL